ncbi:MAG: hypothetical protein LBO64_09210 [Desulfovibrio sp.]|jgi:hypothetical protein|nr:hypothetical protein [Desulfovibrio sp.]
MNISKILNRYGEKLRCTWYGNFQETDFEGKCFCGRSLENEYFEFEGTDSQGNIKIFYGGPHCGRELCKTAELKIPPFFDPFEEDYTLEKNISYKTNTTISRSSHKNQDRRPDNKEVIKAIGLMLYFWKTKSGFYQKKMMEFYENPKYKVFDNLLQKINSLVMKTVDNEAKKRNFDNVITLRQLLDKVAIQNKRSKKQTFQFPELEKRLQNLGDKCFL